GRRRQPWRGTSRAVRAIRDEPGDDFIRYRRSSSGDEIVARAGGIIAITAGGDVVEVGGRQLVEGGQGLGGAIEGALAVQSASLMGDGQQGSPLGRPRTGSPRRQPTAVRPAIVDRVGRESGGVIGNIRYGASRAGLCHDILLESRTRFIETIASATVAPGRL